MLVVAAPAWAALQVAGPLTQNNGTLDCPTCVTESAPTNHGLVVQSATQETGAIGPDASSTKALFSAGSSADPAFRAILYSDITAGTAANFATIIGTPTGSGEFVRATNPSLAGVTITGAVAAGSSTAPWTFPAGAIGAAGLTDVAGALLKGTSAVAKFVTTTSAATTLNNCAKWDANGNLVDSGGTCSGTPALTVVHKDISPLTQLTVLSATPVFCGLDGSCSTTANGTDVQTAYSGTGSFTNINCQAVTGTTNAVTAAVFSGACNGALANGTASNTMSATAWTAGSMSGTTSFTDGQCLVIKFTAGTNAAKATFRCSIKETAST
jgi:hypothetical protein